MFKTTATTSSGQAREKCPTGSFPATLVAMIDLGSHWRDPHPKAKIQEGKWERRLFWVYELDDEPNPSDNGRNHLIGIDLTLEMVKRPNPATGKTYVSLMRKFVEARIGRSLGENEEYDVTTEVGQPVYLTIGENAKGYPIIENVAALSPKMPRPTPTFPLTTLDVDMINKGAEIPDWVPWVYGKPAKDYVTSCRENGGTKNGGFNAPRQNDDAPPPKRNTDGGTDGGATDGPPPRPKPANQGNGHATADHHHATFWMTDREGHDRRFTGQQVCQEMANCDLDPDQTLVCIEGGAEWKPASFYGLQPGIPF